MSHPTKEEFAVVADQLERLFNTVYLRCDGYLICTRVELVAKRQKIVVYINGFIKGAWVKHLYDDQLDQVTEEARRFWQQRTKDCFTKKVVLCAEKYFGKKYCKETGYYRKHIWHDPSWSSATAFIKHIKNNNTDIEILDYDSYKKTLEQLEV